MNLILDFIESKKIQLRLEKDGQVLDTLDFSFKADLDTVLIANVDKFLKKNTIALLSLYRIVIVGNIDKNSSAYTVLKTWISAVEVFNKHQKL